MTVILNLDELLPEAKYVKFRGEDHELVATDTETYLKIVQAQKKLDVAKAGADEEVQTRFAVELIGLALPTIPRNALAKLPLRATFKLVAMIQELMQAEMEDDAPNGQNGSDGRPGELTLVVSSPE